jgi:hypothetical protein
MKIPFSYSLRNLFTRRLTTFLTASGMALVVFVFAAVLMLAQGLQKTLVDTGSYDNVVVIRKAAESEVQSGSPPAGKACAGQDASPRFLGNHFRFEHSEAVPGGRIGRDPPVWHERLEGCRSI